MKSGRFEKVEGSDFELEADLVLLAMGFVGPEKPGLLTDLGVDLNERGNVARTSKWNTNVDGVFVAGDMGRGQSLIVWAIARDVPQQPLWTPTSRVSRPFRHRSTRQRLRSARGTHKAAPHRIRWGAALFLQVIRTICNKPSSIVHRTDTTPRQYDS